MVPWSMRRVTDLPPKAKLLEMQQNAHRLTAQLIRATTPDVPNQTPMPQLSEQMLNASPIPPSPYPQLERGGSYPQPERG